MSIAQALASKDRSLHGKGEFVSKVICTGKQERPGNILRKKSGTDLWKLQLGGCQGATAGPSAGPAAPVLNLGMPSDWQEHAGQKDWLHNRERNLFYATQTGKLFWFDQKANRHREFHEGHAHDLAIRIEGCAHARDGKQGRHVAISDLHEAAGALRIDLSHFDRPAAYFAVFGCGSPTVSAESAAKTLHMRLLPRLAEYRSAWAQEELEQAVKDAFVQDAQGSESDVIEAAIVLILGNRLVAVASRAARGIVVIGACDPASRQPGKGASARQGLLSFDGNGTDGLPRTLCLALEEGLPLGVILSCGDPCLMDVETSEAVMPWLNRGCCKAGCVALLQRGGSGGGPQVAMAARLAWGSGGERDAKRQRVEKVGQVRCRHILVRHTASRPPYDKVRRRPVKRSLEEAEAMQLAVLEELLAHADFAGKGGGFTSQCRKISECESSLKGGELAGDLGWLDLAKRSDKAPAPLAKAALALKVGQLSDLVATELGIHILLRTA